MLGVTPSVRTERRGPLARFAVGVGIFFRGFRVWASSPGLMALGALPALIVGAVIVAGVVVLTVNLPGLAEMVTPFAVGWHDRWRGAVRFAAGLALLVLAILLAVSTFTALTLAVGDPFYERIWLAVERRLGGFGEVTAPGFWTSVRRGMASGLKLLALSAALGIVVFLLGLIPLAGGVLAFSTGALGGGWLVATELIGRPLDGRGLSDDRQRILRGQSRAEVLGFGVAAYLVFLIPFVAIVAMPTAVAGSTILARRVLERGASGQLQRGDRLGRRLP